MNLHHLLIFAKVAERRHFTQAAEELLISQPAVSKQIRELERAVGQPLFKQLGRQVYLTEAGEVLYDYARRIFALVDEAETQLEEMHELEKGHLSIGAITTIGIYLLPAILGYYRSHYPKIELSLEIANADDIQERLLANEVEVGLVEGPVTHADLHHEVWQRDELVLIVGNDHQLARRENICLEEILAEGHPFLLREQGSGTREVFEQALASRELPAIRPFMELGSTEAIKKAVIAGLGISFVSLHTIQLELQAGLLKHIELTDFTLERSLYLTYPRQKRLPRAVQKFLEFLYGQSKL
ncbi:LysR family transcriptional regulator [Ktedonobacter racemifer]|uniref:Transcriptional regulator, LysR family n=1 Tax=Ktedonobacter racemifer DSM 44963 TaxID=485913 RepID=D6TZ39_KTERA|nr:LysR family transcriptional regulator [Ktedonobacter racemifer]EFH81829.1 transcriptional regulator, LysR family [Ktedonobacter racemifer DSM 44963]